MVLVPETKNSEAIRFLPDEWTIWSANVDAEGGVIPEMDRL